MSDDFFSTYMDYVNLNRSEAPATFHRWTLAGSIGALLGRNVYLPFGNGMIYPNQFVMLMGPPGARKGTALSYSKTLLRGMGFNRFAKDRTSKERFLMDMKQFDDMHEMKEEDLEVLRLDAPSESFIMSGEFVDFVGPANDMFLMMLTNLWDNLPEYEHPKIQGKSIFVDKPVVNLLSGATPQTFSMAVPPESLETGFLSRMILVHGDPTGVKVPWPPVPDKEVAAVLKDHLSDIRRLAGTITVNRGAWLLAEKIYDAEIPVDDIRFRHYMQRRHTHLLKLAIVMCCSELRYEVEEQDLIRANTMLALAEKNMPRAMGEFGASRHADSNGKILSFLDGQLEPKNAQDIWRALRNETTLKDLAEILNGLKIAGKIRGVELKGKPGYVINHVETKSWPSALLDRDWLTEQERAYL